MNSKTAVDNQLIQMGPYIFGPNREGGLYQIWLPGMEPLTTFHYWVTVGLYTLLDRDNPTKAVRTSPTELLEILSFSQTLTKATNGGRFYTFNGNQYRLIEDTLHDLATKEIAYRSYAKTPVEGKLTKGGRLIYKKQWSDYHYNILSNYVFRYPPGVTPPPIEDLKRKKLGPTIVSDQPVALTYDQKKKAGHRIRYEAIEYTLNPLLTRGLTGEGIGFTLIYNKLFELRKDFQRNQAATNLLFWIPRQTKTTITTPLRSRPGADGLLKTLNLDPDRPGRAIEEIQTALKTLKKAGMVEAFKVTGDDVTITKATDWPEIAPSDDLPPLPPAKKRKA